MSSPEFRAADALDEFLLGIKTTIFLVGIVGGGGAAAAGGSGITQKKFSS
jgi:hypothetical protein